MIEIFTGILVAITAIYAYLTHRIARATEASVHAVWQQSETSLRPYVNVAPFIRPRALFLYLRLSNTGRTTAKNLQLSLDRDFFQWGEKGRPEMNLRAQNAFNLPIDSLPPGAELVFGLGQGWVLFAKDADPAVTPLQFSVRATYEFFGKTVDEITNIDLRPYLRAEGEADPLVEELARIRVVLDKLSKA